MIGDECRDISEFLIGDEVSFAYHKLYNVPSSSMSERVVNMVTKIDLTETEVRDLGNLRDFPHLEVLVLDKNGLSDLSSLPVLEKVNTLWLNNNHLADLSTLMDDIVKKCPNLVFLSIMRNPCCRGYMDIENPDLEAVRLQRLYVIHRYPRLMVLDCHEITLEEREQSRLRGQYAVKRQGGSQKSPIAKEAVVPMDDVFEEKKGHEGKEFKGKVMSTGNKRFESKHSEGNRFIVNSQL